MSDPIFLTMTGENHGLVSAGCGSKTSIGRYAHVNHEDQIFALSLLSGWGYEKHSERRCMSFHKFIDKSTPLLALGINENERYFLEFDFYRINQFGHFEKYYFIELRGASIIALQMNFDLHSGLDTECITVAYDYIRCRHLVAATEYYHFALPANYNSLFSVQNPIVAARNAAQRSTLNSANVGRLLAAGGVYNQNVEGIKKVAEQLGGDAPKGFKQVLNEKTAGAAIAISSVLMSVSRAGTGSLNVLEETEALQKLTGGAARAAKYAESWPKANLSTAVERFAGRDPIVTITDKGKKIYTHPETGVQVVEDMAGSYFRIYDPSLSGKRSYLDLDGNIPNNKMLDNGKQAGRNQREYNEVTHFNIERNE